MVNDRTFSSANQEVRFGRTLEAVRPNFYVLKSAKSTETEDYEEANLLAAKSEIWGRTESNRDKNLNRKNHRVSAKNFF